MVDCLMEIFNIIFTFFAFDRLNFYICSGCFFGGGGGGVAEKYKLWTVGNITTTKGRNKKNDPAVFLSVIFTFLSG